jgi:hypothetical protein
MKKNLSVFISYKWESPDHISWVERLATDLRKAGIETILDKWYVGYGDSFIDYMTSRIGSADVVLFIMTKKSVEAVESSAEGGAIKFEIQLAKSRSIAGETMRLIGILREKGAVPFHLRDRRYADFSNDALYRINLEALVDDLLGTNKVPVVSLSYESLSLDEIDKSVLETLFSVFGEQHFGRGELSNGIATTDTFWNRFDSLIAKGYITSEIDSSKNKRRFFLADRATGLLKSKSSEQQGTSSPPPSQHDKFVPVGPEHTEQHTVYDPCDQCAERLMGVGGEPCVGCSYKK